MSVFSKQRLKNTEPELESRAEYLCNCRVEGKGKPIVLLIDDEPENLFALELLLKDDFRLVKAQSGEQAVQFLKTVHNPEDLAVIISDQRMPNMTGIEVLEEAQTVTPSAIRILLTAYTDVEDAITAINIADIYRYLVKPIDEYDLKLTVARAAEAFDMKRSLNRCILDLDQVVAEQTKSFNRDIAELKANVAELRQASMTDPLTQLLNRRGFEYSIGNDARFTAPHETDNSSNEAFAFILCDIDHFKQINDSYGHLAGDDVLKAIAEVFHTCFRKNDYLVRWGGEEFLAVTSVGQCNEAQLLAERLRQAIAALTVTLHTGQRLNCTASIGYACSNIASNDMTKWKNYISLADEGLYAAKHNGRNAWVGVSAAALPEITADIADTVEQSSRPLQVLLEDKAVTVHSSFEAEKGIHWQFD